MRTRFSPCGMVWTYLRSCYSFTMRVFIGGVEREFPARWFWCLPGAQPFPGVHGCEASPWLKNAEINNAWGEVTPYPTDRNGPDIRGVDRGLNPGYAGQCYVGQQQWFVDGQLPGNILDGPPPPMPACCEPAATLSAGGVVVGGGALPHGPGRTKSLGGLVLGGSATAKGPLGAYSAGGLVLGGSAVPYPQYRVLSGGGLVLGGSAAAGTGGISTACCPDDKVDPVIDALISGAVSGVCVMTYDNTLGVWVGVKYICGGEASVFQLACKVETWLLSIQSGLGATYEDANPISVRCNPLRIVFIPQQPAPGNCAHTTPITVTIVKHS